MRLLLSMLALAVVASGPALAQDAPADTVLISPGDGVLVTDWITPGATSYTMRLTAPMQQDVGTMSETVAISDGRVTRVTTISVPMQGMTQVDSVVATTAFVPLAHVSTGGGADASLEFMDEGVVGLVTPRQGEATTVLLETDAPVFDTAWAGEIAQSLPFSEGAVFKALSFSYQSPDEAGDMVYSVTGREDVDGISAWVVKTEMGPVTFTYLVDPDTRDLLMSRFSPQPGVSIELAPDAE
ncbi:MAG: hypothetical protein AAGK21_16155 [Bacteroidota bacterium]